MDCYWHLDRSFCVSGYRNDWTFGMVDAQEEEVKKGHNTVRVNINVL